MSVSKAPTRRGTRWRTLHRWLACVFGAIFVVQGLSGSLLVLADPLDDWLNPDLTVAAGQRMPLVEMADTLERTHPGATGVGVTQIDAAGRLTTAFWPTPDPLIASQNRYWLARLHPASGAALSVMPYGAWSFERHDLIGLLYALHTSLTLGALGKLLQIVAAACLLLLLLAGALTWLHRSRALRGKAAAAIVDTNVARWHRRIGATAGLALALLLGSGLALQFETVLDPSFGYRSQASQGRPRLTLRQAWSAAHARHPDAATRLIMAPFADGGVFRVDLVPHSGPSQGETVEVFVDAYAGHIVKQRHGADREGVQRLLGWIEALHGGAIVGWPGQVLTLFTGLLPAFLLATGLLMARCRRRAQAALLQSN